MDTTVIKYLVTKNRERQQTLMEHLATGAAKDYAEYREIVGAIRGLAYANDNLQDLLDQSKEMDDE